MKNIESFEELVEKAFSDDSNEAFSASIELARACGVPDKDILKNEQDVNALFLD